MPIKVACTCGRKLTAKDELAGKKVKCPGCQKLLSIPQPDVPKNSSDDEWDFGDPEDEEFRETSKAPARSSGAKLPPARGSVSRNGNLKGKGTTPSSQNRGLLIGGLVAAGVLAAALLTWTFWPKAPGSGVTASANPDAESDAGNAEAATSANAVTQTSATGQTGAATVGGGKAARTTPYLRLPGAVSEPPEWLVAEAPFDVRELFRSVPEDDNAAPLYLEALVEFSSDLISCYPEDQRELLRQQLRPRFEKFNRLFSAWETNRASVSAAEQDACLKEFEQGFEKLAAAQQRPQCVFETGITFSASAAHAQPVRAVARVFQLQTARDLEQGKFERPLQLQEILLRLNRDLRYRGFTVSQLVGLSSDMVAFKVAAEILNSPGCSQEHCDRLLALLARQEKEMPDSAVIALKMEYLIMRSAMHDIEHRTGDFSPEGMARFMQDMGLNDKPSIGGVICAFNSGLTPQRATQIDSRIDLLTAADYTREADTLKNYFRDAIEVARQPFPQAQVSLKSLVNAGVNSMTLYLFQDARSMNLTELGVATAAKSAALHRGTRCLVALRRWQLQGKGIPTDLATVCREAGMESVPIDPYSGSGLRMTQISGQPVIYSIGPDLADDQARLEYSMGREVTPGDLLFRLAIPFR